MIGALQAVYKQICMHCLLLIFNMRMKQRYEQFPGEKFLQRNWQDRMLKT
jgi:hypothetical protein